MAQVHYQVLASLTGQEFKALKQGMRLLGKNGFSHEDALDMLLNRLATKKGLWLHSQKAEAVKW